MYGSHDGTGGTATPTEPFEYCAAVTAQLSAYYDGLLPADEARVVASHLATCSLCSARLDALARADQLICMAPAPRVGPELRQTLYDRITAAGHDQASLAPIRRIRISEMPINETGHLLSRATATRRSPRQVSIWLSGIAAALIVALLGSIILTQGHGPNHHVVGAGTPTTTAGGCAPSTIQANLPAHAYLYDLAMTSATEGWAVGTVRDSNDNAPVRTVILHYSACHWTEAGPSVPGTSLTSISMDSPTDGWAIGPTYTTRRVLMHYTGGQWHLVRDPIAGNAPVTYSQIRMLSPSEGWLVAGGSISGNDTGGEWFLHYQSGAWTTVKWPETNGYGITDIAPVGPDDLWVVGTPDGPDLQGGILAHYAAGKWSVPYHAPGNILLDSIRMLSPTDGWATGEAFPPDNFFEGVAKPAVLRYDGTTWRGIRPTSNANAQRVRIFGDDEAWAFSMTHRPSDQVPIDLATTLAQYESGGRWRTVKMPADDFTSVTGLSRAAAGEYWAIGTYQTYTQSVDPNGVMVGRGTNYSVLLHYVNGTWTQYGR